jgi:hypothetical protein
MLNRMSKTITTNKRLAVINFVIKIKKNYLIESSYKLQILSKELRDKEEWRKVVMIENCYFCYLCHFLKF